MATISEVATECKVSRALVSRLLNKDPELRIADSTRDRIHQVVHRLGGVKVNHAARSLRTRRSYCVCAPVHYQTIEFGVRMPAKIFFEHLKTSLRVKGFSLTISLFDPAEGLAPFVELLDTPTRCDGLVLLTSVVDQALAQLLRERQFPHVSIDPAAEEFEVNTVIADAMGGLRQAVAHLFELGHRDIGFFGALSFPRFPLFVAAMQEKRLVSDPEFNCIIPPPVGFNQENWLRFARAEFEQWLKDKPPVTAMVCHNDDLAIIAVEAIRRCGLWPGRDLSVVGYDNIEVHRASASGEPELTTVDNPMGIIGQRCAHLLMDQILEKRSQIVHERIPTKLVVRTTTAPCSQRTATSAQAEPSRSGKL